MFVRRQRLIPERKNLNSAIGLTALTRQGIAGRVTAGTELTVLVIPFQLLEELVRQKPALARELGKEVDNRRRLVWGAFEATGLNPPKLTGATAY